MSCSAQVLPRLNDDTVKVVKNTFEMFSAALGVIMHIWGVPSYQL